MYELKFVLNSYNSAYIYAAGNVAFNSHLRAHSWLKLLDININMEDKHQDGQLF